MREHPILFQDRLVRANLEDRKTETRRVGPAADRWLRAEAGDILWVREAWAKYSNGYAYRATASQEDQKGVKWKPSIHFPRIACRLFLELREKPWKEPLQEMTLESAIAEGVRPQVGVIIPGEREYLDFEGIPHPYATAAFSIGWDRINAARGYGWNANPEVVVLRYRRLP